MAYEKGDKIKGTYLGEYSFTGSIWHTEVSTHGQNLYLDLDRPIFVNDSPYPRTSILIESHRNENNIEIMLDNL